MFPARKPILSYTQSLQIYVGGVQFAEKPWITDAKQFEKLFYMS